MANFIVKIPHNGKDYYLIWDTNVDAPAIYGCSLTALKDYYLQEYGQKSLIDFNERLSRVEKKGVSSHIHDNFDELIMCNRAGDNEERLTKQEIIDKFCREEFYV